MTDISNKRILIIATDGFEQQELTVPLQNLRAAGADVTVASPQKTREPGFIQGWDGTAHKADWGDKVRVDYSLDEVSAADFDALVIPGGQINPDKLRTEPRAVELVRDFFDSGKVVAAICHGPWLLVEAGVVEGHKVTSYGSIKTDVLNAGGRWVDAEVVTDHGLITSRNPGDLDAFCAKIAEEVSEGRHARA